MSRTIKELELLQVPFAQHCRAIFNQLGGTRSEEQGIGRKLSTENARILEKQAELEGLR